MTGVAFFDIDNFQLEEGVVATEYERPAPAPDYPSEIYSLNDFDVVSSVGGKNLLRNSGEEVSNGLYNIARYDLTDEIKEEEEVTLTIWGSLATTKTSFRAYNSGGSVSVVTLTDNGDGTYSNTFKWKIGSSTNTYLNVYAFTNTQTGTSTINKIKLEKGNVSTDWTPALEDITENDNNPLIDKINLLLSKPLRSVGDVKDRLFRDSDGLWKTERRIGEKVFNGSETWNLEQRFANDEMVQMYTRSGITNMRLGGSGKALSNRFVDIKQEATLDGNKKTGMYANTSYTDVIRFKVLPDSIGSSMENSNAEIIQAWNTWLSKNETYVIYELEAPTVEILPMSTQDKLNNLSSFSNSNYVYIVDSNNLKPTLHVTFKSSGWYSRWRTEDELEKHQDQLDKTIDTDQLNTIVADINADKLSVESYESFLSSYEGSLKEVNRSIEDVAADIGKALSRTNIIETTLGEGAQDWLFTNTKIRMSDEGITLGDASSGTYLQISSERISFFAGATDEVAYVSGGMLYINKAIFVQSIQVAEYLISKELDGHLTYRFVGMV